MAVDGVRHHWVIRDRDGKIVSVYHGPSITSGSLVRPSLEPCTCPDNVEGWGVV